ncbi:MAG: membrane protein insertion efficiency factor YidD [Fretibacterium sp.]|nr:membrane protein insertion efficiency factor YidD [Fretibacterium sp.]
MDDLERTSSDRASWGRNPAVWCAILLIRCYQIFLSPFLGRSCRFYPTCSHYALFVFREWGFFRGALLTLWRLLRCGPWCEGGCDLPPRRQPRDVVPKEGEGVRSPLGHGQAQA